MTLAAITITILAFVVIAQRVRMYVLDDEIALLNRHCNELEAICREVFDQRDEARQLLAWREQQITGHIIDTESLNAELQRLKLSESEAIVEDVARWLADA